MNATAWRLVALAWCVSGLVVWPARRPGVWLLCMGASIACAWWAERGAP